MDRTGQHPVRPPRRGRGVGPTANTAADAAGFGAITAADHVWGSQYTGEAGSGEKRTLAPVGEVRRRVHHPTE